MSYFLVVFHACIISMQGSGCFDGEDNLGEVINGKPGYYRTVEECLERGAEAEIKFRQDMRERDAVVRSFDFYCQEVKVNGREQPA